MSLKLIPCGLNDFLLVLVKCSQGIIIFEKYSLTRMQSSRMRTVRCSDRHWEGEGGLPSGDRDDVCPVGGAFAQGDGVCPGVYLPKEVFANYVADGY